MSNTNSSSHSFSSSESPVVDASTPVQEIPVLIVGAGPVGLFEAVLLTKMGIRVRIIERSSQISEMSRALATQARSLEILAMVEDGFIDKFLSQGRSMKNVHMFYGSHFRSKMSFTKGTDSRYEGALLMEQERLSKVLAKDLAEMGVNVEFGWELADTEVVESAKDTHVKTVIHRTVALEGEERERQVIRSEYLVAADGGRSTVRHKANIKFPGKTLVAKTIMFDGILDTDLDLQDFTVITGVNQKSVLVFRMSDNRHRVVLEMDDFTPEDDLEKINRELTVEDFERETKAYLHPGTKFKVVEKFWLTCYRINERRADNYIHKGRIFLAGDAAHVHSPAGGQGMNTGLQDAHNLAWKLALVLNHLAPASILQSYQEERQPMADRAIALSSKLLRNARYQGTMNHYVKRVLLLLSLLLIHVQSAAFPLTATMLDVRYPANNINLPHKTQEQPKGEVHQVGARAPDGPLLRLLLAPAEDELPSVHNSNTTSLEKQRIHVQELTMGVGKFHILVLVGKSFSDPASFQEREADLVKHVEENLSEWRTRWHFDSSQDNQIFKLHVIATGTMSQSHGNGFLAQRAQGDGLLFWDNTEEVHKSYGVPTQVKGRANNANGLGAIVVIRPDSHIGYRVEGLGKNAWADVSEYFHTILS
ncbi:MAG: FAD binding domain-containing protein [Podila humilis]|nr:MAG: FAD binding domain-containing protein [Podila humilis]